MQAQFETTFSQCTPTESTKNYSRVGPLKEMLMFQCKTLCACLCFYTGTGLDAISLAKEMIHSLLL